MKLREIKKKPDGIIQYMHDGLSRALPRVMQFNFDAVNYIDFAVSLLKHTVKIKCVKSAKKWKFNPCLPSTKLTRLLAHREKKRERTREMTVKPLLTYFLQKGK